MPRQKNVLGGALETCGESPLTGFYRSGRCETGQEDLGAHVVCAQVTPEFLEFSRAQGNDLTVPGPESGFPGLESGDRWCLCALRWVEALRAGCAPPVVLAATNESVLQVVSFVDLLEHAIDPVAKEKG